jgi:periplasmic divalent cation tolerance protein
MNSLEVVLIYATAPDAVVAERIGRTLVEEEMAACANVLPGMRSVYRWQGRVETADEAVLILKTLAGQAAATMERLRALHPYQEPCALVLPVSGGLQTYLAWVAAGVR